MEPRIDPAARLGTALLAALQAQPGDAQVQALLGFVGESLDLVLLTNEGGTARLQMPSGQVIEAKGDVPYPPGTRLTVQVLPPDSGQAAPRLKLVEATPPPPLTILAPLQQGEALQLLARLSVPETPPALAALARLFSALGAEGKAGGIGSASPGHADPVRPGADGARPAATPQESAGKGPMPLPAPRVVELLKGLPPAALRDLQRILFPAAARAVSMAETAEGLQQLLQALELGKAGPEPGPRTAAPGLRENPARADLPAAARAFLDRLEQTLSPSASAANATGGADPAQDALQDFVLNLLRSIPRTAPAAAMPPPALAAGAAQDVSAEGVPERPAEGKLLALLKDLPPAVLKDLQRVLFPAADRAPTLQETADGLRQLLLARDSAAPAPAAREVLAKVEQALAPPPGPGPAAEALRTLLSRPSGTETAPTRPEASPSTERILALLKDLPPAVLKDLQRVLFPAADRAPTLQETADGLRQLLLARDSAAPAPAAREVLAKVEQALAPPQGPGPAAEALRTLLSRPSGTETAPPRPEASPSTERILALLKDLPPAVLKDLQRALFPAADRAPTLQETADGLRQLLLARDSAAPAPAAREALAKVEQALAPPPGPGPAAEALRTLLSRPSGTEAAPPRPEASPSTERILALLKDLPPAALKDLQRVLFLAADRAPTLQETADGLRQLLLARDSAAPAPAAREVLAKVEQALAPPPGPGPAAEALRTLLSRPSATEAAPTRPEASPSTERTLALLKDLPPAVLKDLQRALFPATDRAPTLQETADGLRQLLLARDSAAPAPAAREVLAKVEQALAPPQGPGPAAEALRTLLSRPPATEAAPTRAEAPPSTERILALLKDLPPAALKDLQRALFPAADRAPTLQETADGLRQLLLARDSAAPAPAAREVLAKVEQALAPPQGPGPAAEALRTLLSRPSGTETAPPRPEASPSTERILALLKDLPPAVLKDLQRALFPAADRAPTLQETADGLRQLLLARDSAAPAPAAREVLAKVEQALAPPPGPDSAAEALRTLLSRPSATEAAPPRPEASPSTERILALLKDLPPAVLKDLQRVLFPAAETPPTLAELAQALRTLWESTGIRGQAASSTPQAGLAEAAIAARTVLNELQALLSVGLTAGQAPAPLGRLLQFLQQPAVPGAEAGRALAEGVPGGPLTAFEPGQATLPAPAQAPPPNPSTAPLATNAAGPALPSTGRVAALLRDLPKATLLAFQGILLPAHNGQVPLPELAEAIRSLLRALPPATSPGLASPARVLPATGPGPAVPATGPGRADQPEAPPPAAQPTRGSAPPAEARPAIRPGLLGMGFAEAFPELLLRVQQGASLPAPSLPTLAFLGSGDPALEPLKNLLMVLLRPAFATESASPALADLLARAAAGAAREAPLATLRGPGPEALAPPAPGPVAARAVRIQAAPAPGGESAPAAQVPQAPRPLERAPAQATEPNPSAAPAARPAAVEAPAVVAKSWESWLSAGTRALSDPQVSPREAPFHLAQAREGTAFFELPLPWESADRTLQMWVEEDAGEGARSGSERTLRVLVGLHFSALGDTRVGIQQSGDRLQVRVWAEHPEILRAREASIAAELADLGPGLDLQVYPLGEPGEAVPSLRALAAGSAFHALG